MTKNFAVFITSLIVLTFIAGCPPVKPEPIEHQKVEPLKAEPNKVETQKVESHPAVSFHDKCADILRNYVDDKGMVDYKTLKRKRSELKSLLNEFAELDPNKYNPWPKEDKIAFWLNAYNIQLLKIIIDNYPIKSSPIRRLFWYPTSIRHLGNIWNDHKFLVMDEEFTLAEIEQRFFCKEFGEPRVFFAISGATISSPPFRNEPYRGHPLYRQLDEQTKKFLFSTQGFRIDRKNKRVYLSAMLEPNWHGKDFIHKYGTDKKFKDQQPAVRAVLNFITNYISKQDVSFLEVENYYVKYISYDWRLNE